jgi:hypothetical protein
MDDKKKDPQTHPDLGDVGDLGDAGDLGTNAHSRPAANVVEVPPAAGAQPSTVAATVEAQLVSALVNAGFEPEESVQMAKAAIIECARRKGR